MKRFFRKLKFCTRILKSKDTGWIVIQIDAEQQFKVLENRDDVLFGASYISVDPRVVHKLVNRLNQQPKDVPQPSLN